VTIPGDELRYLTRWRWTVFGGTLLNLAGAGAALIAEQWLALPWLGVGQIWLTVAWMNSMTIWERDVELKLLRDRFPADLR
jgi:hypothetical protein